MSAYFFGQVVNMKGALDLAPASCLTARIWGTGVFRAMGWGLTNNRFRPLGRASLRVAALSLVVAMLSACSAFEKDVVIPDEPADKLYNEGLFLLNSKKDAKN